MFEAEAYASALFLMLKDYKEMVLDGGSKAKIDL